MPGVKGKWGVGTFGKERPVGDKGQLGSNLGRKKKNNQIIKRIIKSIIKKVIESGPLTGK